MDELSPKRFVSMMQQVLGVITELAAISGVISLPEPEACAAFVTAPYLPASIGPTVIEGTRLLNLLNISLGTLRRSEAPAPAPQPQTVQQTVPRFRSDVDTSGIRQRFERGRNRKWHPIIDHITQTACSIVPHLSVLSGTPLRGGWLCRVRWQTRLRLSTTG